MMANSTIIIIFGIKSAVISKKNLIANLYTIKNFLKTKIKSHDDEATDFHDKEIPKSGSDYTYLAVVSLYFSLKKAEIYYPQVFLKECKYIEKENKCY